jgi:hypothetical protein
MMMLFESMESPLDVQAAAGFTNTITANEAISRRYGVASSPSERMSQ